MPAGGIFSQDSPSSDTVAGSTGGAYLTLPFPYFVVEWLDGTIDQFFENQYNHKALAKLELFNDVLLSIAAIHRYDIPWG